MPTLDTHSEKLCVLCVMCSSAILVCVCFNDLIYYYYLYLLVSDDGTSVETREKKTNDLKGDGVNGHLLFPSG